MAPKVTSSSTRSKRKPAKPPVVTTSKGRTNRSSVSNATVTNSEGRGQNNGSAKVTQGKGGSGTTPKALPPGLRGGAVVTRPPSAVVNPKPKAPQPRGGAIEKAGATVDVKANMPKLGQGAPARPPAARPALPPSARAAVRGMGGLRAGLVGLVAAPVVDEIGRRAGTALGKTIRQAATPQRTGTTSGRTGRGGTTADRNTSQTNATAGRYVPGSQQVPIAKPKPQDKQSTPSSRSGGSSGSGGTSGGNAPSAPRSSSAPARRSAAPASNAGMKNQDKNFRGNLFEKTFGYKRGEAPDQVKNKPSSFDTKSDVYTPSTKVDGSKLDALKIDQKKVDEYKRRKDRYYS